VHITFTPVDDRGDDRVALVTFLTAHTWPFHVVTRPTPDVVAAALERGRFNDEDHAAFWVDSDEEGRLGLVVLEDLTDETPLFDLRLAEEHRGRGLGAVVLRALTDHVFTTLDVHRLEGQTREDNRAMRRTFVRAGYVKEAHYREGWPVEGGTPVASVAYAVLRRDWQHGTTTPVPWDEDLDAPDSSEASGR
jgi:RimJ/RimL family protein N-acetyltransferase